MTSLSAFEQNVCLRARFSYLKGWSMTRADVTVGRRRAELVRGAFGLLAEYPHGVHKNILMREMQKRFPPREGELTPTSRNRNAYTGHVGWGTSDAAAGPDGHGVGWIRKSGDGHWSITPAGRQALEIFPDANEFMAEIKRLKALLKKSV